MTRQGVAALEQKAVEANRKVRLINASLSWHVSVASARFVRTA